ncbi:unnamed protein product [Rotaria magnacalcarata]|uniref:Uncharacterized protein n=1 Tax=Rotaria magnacalcarata TaxID=392030 RepID=A0A816NPM3_9BILA|nr:unnamed protein product [Rotaria magnacalcarata]CAF2155242.1 unnamed protein product [Rotaria magnacalcarata]CAF3960648.1 unnamed protein product [Rotaria magnacalcarata]CAF4378414.1 unnamed protein product [Rotaria magnacalcarata]
MLVLYGYVCCRAKYSSIRVFHRRGGERQQDRDFKVFRNIMILFGIYLSGGIPTATVAVKNSVTLFLDRELFNALKKFIRRRNTRVMPALS